MLAHGGWGYQTHGLLGLTLCDWLVSFGFGLVSLAISLVTVSVESGVVHSVFFDCQSENVLAVYYSPKQDVSMNMIHRCPPSVATKSAFSSQCDNMQ